jgi:hypothetical protein
MVNRPVGASRPPPPVASADALAGEVTAAVAIQVEVLKALIAKNNAATLDVLVPLAAEVCSMKEVVAQKCGVQMVGEMLDSLSSSIVEKTEGLLKKYDDCIQLQIGGLGLASAAHPAPPSSGGANSTLESARSSPTSAFVEDSRAMPSCLSQCDAGDDVAEAGEDVIGFVPGIFVRILGIGARPELNGVLGGTIRAGRNHPRGVKGAPGPRGARALEKSTFWRNIGGIFLVAFFSGPEQHQTHRNVRNVF